MLFTTVCYLRWYRLVYDRLKIYGCDLRADCSIDIDEGCVEELLFNCNIGIVEFSANETL